MLAVVAVVDLAVALDQEELEAVAQQDVLLWRAQQILAEVVVVLMVQLLELPMEPMEDQE
jgi:hypothetical protein